ncbi:hypothetical protein ACOZ35_01820 [Halorubrum xinjiangense]|uniref:hypothetical protein n=1 Tax=Halorubrum xinjiangense TaxID=261291 RepID=UPI003C6F8112
MLELNRNAPKRAVLPNDSEDFDWGVWSVIEPIFKHSRSESNRVYDMVANLIKASAMVNFHSRDTVTWNVRTEDGLEEVEGVVATAQDVANVVRCLDVLRATTYGIDQRKRAIVDAINVKGDGGAVDGLDPIIDYLEESDASQVNLPELRNTIDDLEADYLISVDGDQYTVNNWDALGEPPIDEHARFFTDCEDPLSGDPSLDWWDSRRDETETRGSDLLGEPELESTGTSVGTDAGVKDSIVDFDVDAEPWVADVLGRSRAHSTARLSPTCPS